MNKKYFLVLLFSCWITVGFTQQFNPDSSQVYYINDIAYSSSNITAFDDGNNGSYVLWLDGRASTNKTAIYFQHLNQYGVPQFAKNGKMLLSANSTNSYLAGYKAIKTQSGFMVSWTTHTDSLFCNYFSFSGNPLWAQPTLISTKGASMIYISDNGMNIMPTDSGFFINYSIIYTGGSEGFAFNRVDFNGNLRWPINYFQINTSGYYLATTNDKNKRFYYAVSTGGLGAHLYVQHFNLQGVKSYATNLDISTGAGGRGNSTWRIVCDDDTNAYVVWESYTANKIVISKITPNNGLAWTPDYRTICGYSGTQSDPYIIFSDNSIYTIWNDGRSPAANYFIYAQRTDTAGNMLWRQDGDSLCRLGSYIPTPFITKNASGDLVATFLMGKFMTQRIDTLANHKWAPNGRVISSVNSDKPFYSDYALVSNPDSSTTIYWLSFSTKKVCAAKVNYSGNLENAVTLPDGANAINGNDTICPGSSSLVYSISPIANAQGYRWELPPGVSSTSGSDSTLTPTISLNFSGSSSSATIRVLGYNNFGDGAASPDFTIVINPLPDSISTISGANSAAACVNQYGFVYTISKVRNASSYSWTLPSLAAIVGNANDSSIVVNYSPYSTSGIIKAGGVNSCGTGPAASLAITYKAIPTAEICRATIDSATQKTIIEWQKPSESYVNGYVIFREINSVYTAIDTIPNTVFSSFLDTGSNPTLQSEKYKIAVLDSCGNTGDVSAAFQHETIHLYGSIQPGGIAKLYWSDYVGISDTNRYFRVMRDNSGSGAFVQIDSTQKNVLSYSDLASGAYPTCRYVIEMVYESNCTPGFRMFANKSSSRSNIKNKTSLFDSTGVGINTVGFDNSPIQIYPNPTKEVVTIQLPVEVQNYELEITDIIGQILLKENGKMTTGKKQLKFDCSQLQKGMYLLKLKTATKLYTQKIMKE